jgi:hypothetical protein
MDKQPPVDEQIQHWVSEHYGFVPSPANRPLPDDGACVGIPDV